MMGYLMNPRLGQEHMEEMKKKNQVDTCIRFVFCAARVGVVLIEVHCVYVIVAPHYRKALTPMAGCTLAIRRHVTPRICTCACHVVATVVTKW
jgi:hypothetical protein